MSAHHAKKEKDVKRRNSVLNSWQIWSMRPWMKSYQTMITQAEFFVWCQAVIQDIKYSLIPPMVSKTNAHSTQPSNKTRMVCQTTIIRDPRRAVRTKIKPRSAASSMTGSLNHTLIRAVVTGLSRRTPTPHHKITDSKRTITKIRRSLKMIRGLQAGLHARYAARRDIPKIATARITRLRNE